MRIYPNLWLMPMQDCTGSEAKVLAPRAGWLDGRQLGAGGLLQVARAWCAVSRQHAGGEHRSSHMLNFGV